jgi:hypothetical protein
MSKLWIFYTVMAVIWATRGYIAIIRIKGWSEDTLFVQQFHPRLAACIEITVVVLWAVFWPLSLAWSISDMFKKESK